MPSLPTAMSVTIGTLQRSTNDPEAPFNLSLQRVARFERSRKLRVAKLPATIAPDLPALARKK